MECQQGLVHVAQSRIPTFPRQSCVPNSPFERREGMDEGNPCIFVSNKIWETKNSHEKMAENKTFRTFFLRTILFSEFFQFFP